MGAQGQIQGQSEGQKVNVIHNAPSLFLMHFLDSLANFLSNDINFMKIGQPVTAEEPFEFRWPRPVLAKHPKRGGP